MRCYYHSESDAVALCKNCLRGLCRGCAVDVGKGTACRDRCEIDVAVLDQLVTRSRSSFAAAGVAYRRNAIMYALLSGVCLAFGAWAWRSGIGWFLVPTGLVFLLGAYHQSATARKYGRAPM